MYSKQLERKKLSKKHYKFNKGKKEMKTKKTQNKITSISPNVSLITQIYLGYTLHIETPRLALKTKSNQINKNCMCASCRNHNTFKNKVTEKNKVIKKDKSDKC